MASRAAPRSVKDATRFTSTIPTATSKAGASATAPSAAAKAKAAAQVAAEAGRPSRIPGETPEQRVRRLRQAHLAAQKAKVSTSDRVIDGSRRVFNVMHRWLIIGIITFTVCAGIVSAYSVWDMLRYNRARRAEWLAAQARLEADALATARLAYMQGKATPEQTILVEEANAAAEASGTKLPPLLSPPEKRTHLEDTVNKIQEKAKGGKGVWGVVSGIFGGGKAVAETAQEEAAVVANSAKRTEQKAENLVQAVEEKTAQAWEQEKANQKHGGPLDQLGVDAAGASKKGWWPW